MSIPMGTNTEGLREILRQVYDLPDAGSGDVGGGMIATMRIPVNRSMLPDTANYVSDVTMEGEEV